MKAPRASIIISSYNYARFLRQAIESALSQDVSDVEVIVVDDGSTDESPQIIRSCENRIKPILKPNAGQASAINAGFAASNADVVFLLDSDDVLLPDAVRSVLPVFREHDVVKAHWPMQVIDEVGSRQGKLVPSQRLSDGDLREAILREGPEAYEWPPTSGNAWRRSFLEDVLPIPQEHFRTRPDLYLAALAPVAGVIRRIDRPLSLWRSHAANASWNEPFETRLPRFIRQWDLACDGLVEYCHRHNLPADPQRWRDNAWCHRVQRAVEIICNIVPQGSSFILIDQNDWGADERFFGRRCRRFSERDGKFWGLPADDHAAIAEIEQQRNRGAAFAILAWPCFWMKEHYPNFITEIRERYAAAHADDDVMIFDLWSKL